MGMLQDIQSRGKGHSVPTKCLSVSRRSEAEQLRRHQRQDSGFGKRWKCGSVGGGGGRGQNTNSSRAPGILEETG